MTGFRSFGEGGVIAPSSIQTVFNGTNLDKDFGCDRYSFRTLEVNGRGVADYATFLDNPETMHGGIFRSRWLEPRNITVKYMLQAEDNETFRQAYNELNGILRAEQKELTFTDEDAYYIATLTSSEMPDENANKIVATLTFTCADPHKYGEEYEETFSGGSVTVNNEGNAPTYPVITGVLAKDLTYLDIGIDADNFLSFGIPEEVEYDVYDPNEIVLHDEMNSTANWSTATSVDNGVIRGEMISDGSAFVPDTYGTVVIEDRWQGPSLQRSLPGNTTITNFRVEAIVELDNTAGDTTGMLEIYLRDTSNNVIGKIGIEDRWTSLARTFAKAQAGDSSSGEVFVQETASNPSAWVGFKGMIRLSRIENVWYAYYAIIDNDGNHVSRRTIRYTDAEELFTADLAQIQVATRIYPDTERAPMRIEDIKVSRRRDVQTEPEDSIAYIAKQGDIIEINHFTDDFRVNGESLTQFKELASNYFPIQAGEQDVHISPSDAGTFTLKYRKRLT